MGRQLVDYETSDHQYILLSYITILIQFIHLKMYNITGIYYLIFETLVDNFILKIICHPATVYAIQSSILYFSNFVNIFS